MDYISSRWLMLMRNSLLSHKNKTQLQNFHFKPKKKKKNHHVPSNLNAERQRKNNTRRAVFRFITCPEFTKEVIDNKNNICCTIMLYVLNVDDLLIYQLFF